MKNLRRLLSSKNVLSTVWRDHYVAVNFPTQVYSRLRRLSLAEDFNPATVRQA